jgi:hypothetical protein
MDKKDQELIEISSLQQKILAKPGDVMNDQLPKAEAMAE